MGSVATFLDGRSKPADDPNLDTSFSDRVWRLLDRIDCRVVATDEEREAVYRLRYSAYLRDGTIEANPYERFSDPFDEFGNVYLLGLYLDGELASSVRIHVGSKEHGFPSLGVFPEFLQPEVDAGKIFIDPTRFVTDEEFARRHRALPYVTTRLCGMAARYFGAEHLLAAVRVEHQAFYRRIFNHRVVCEARPYPHLAKPISLMTIHYPTIAEEVHRRHPFFRSTYTERRMLFGRDRPVAEPKAENRNETTTPP
jgi:N-acyl-L-homoserine lactone synthetase